MNRLRPAFTWLAFGLCLVVIGGAMVWMSVTMLRQERGEFENDRLARHSENERLALWRMESALIPLIAQESSRPEYAFRSFYSLEVLSKWFTKVERGEIQFPSELLTNDSPHVLIHFQIGPDGKLTSPQVPTGNMRDVAEERYTTHEKIKSAERQLKAVSAALDRKRLLRLLSIPKITAPAPNSPVQVTANSPNDGPQQQSGQVQTANAQRGRYAARNTVEFQKRMQNRSQLINDVGSQMFGKGTRIKPMKAVWIDDQLILAREARSRGKQLIQGCVLNWPELRKSLVRDVADLLPGCRLVPVKFGDQRNPQDMLASIPVRLVAVPAETESVPTITPMRLSLGFAWICFLLAAISVAWLLLAAMRLSERRGAFVSAVTHELRTPLTTFRMYTEMLSHGMVGEDQQHDYLQTLHKEADRLGHLVENVLSYARLESHKKRPVYEKFALDSMLDRMRGALARRIEEAGMQLDWQCNGEASVMVRADFAAVERIVVNLVDNACKYARNADDRRLKIECRIAGSHAIVSVRDFGPGVSPEVQKRMFLPFSKSDREAANTAPGVGLGLSLSRGLSRSMGGDLKLITPVLDQRL